MEQKFEHERRVATLEMTGKPVKKAVHDQASLQAYDTKEKAKWFSQNEPSFTAHSGDHAPKGTQRVPSGGERVSRVSVPTKGSRLGIE